MNGPEALAAAMAGKAVRWHRWPADKRIIWNPGPMMFEYVNKAYSVNENSLASMASDIDGWEEYVKPEPEYKLRPGLRFEPVNDGALVTVHRAGTVESRVMHGEDIDFLFEVDE